MKQKWIDNTGMKFGKWTVIERDGLIGRAAAWRCVCECGLEKRIEGSSLRRGKTTGCMSCSRQIRPFEAIYNLLVGGASNRGIECSLTYEEYVSFTGDGVCHYCNSQISWVRHAIGKNGQNYNIDRMDSSFGYHKWNCVPCCTSCNKTKSNTLTYAEMVAVGKMRQFVAPTS